MNNEYVKFVNHVVERAAWYDWAIPATYSYEDMELEDLTGSQIRKRRAKAEGLAEVMEANHPAIIGVITPPWMWRRLSEILDLVQNFDLNAYDYTSYDAAAPGAVYSGDRMLLKELFAGSIDAKYELGAKIDGTTVDEATFNHRATKYIILLLTQIAQISRKQNAKVEGDGTVVT